MAHSPGSWHSGRLWLLLKAWERSNLESGMLRHTCKPSTWEAREVITAALQELGLHTAAHPSSMALSTGPSGRISEQPDEQEAPAVRAHHASHCQDSTASPGCRMS